MAWVNQRWVAAMLACLLLCAAVASQAIACPICIGFPQKTDADYLIDGRCVVLARPPLQDPFEYAVHEVLKGAYDGSRFDLLVDNATRRALEAYPDRSVLLVQTDSNGPWLNLGLTTPEFESVVRHLIAVGGRWRGSRSEIERCRYFLPLFGHAQERIRNLAYLELGRAPYSMIRPLGKSISREMLSPYLDNRQYTEWQGLAILLLAQSELASDRERIQNTFRDCLKFGSHTNLSAWIAAAVEVDPMGALPQIETHYFENPARTSEELRAVVVAISMLGSEKELPVRERIIASYGVLLRHRPQFAPRIARDLLAWQRSEWVEPLIEISQQPMHFDFGEIQAIQRYVRSVSTAPATGSVDD